MDEADKYKQRLEAIAEKRRLQEEQDRVRREMEEEKLRLQQLKRKSLRDQWLMEGPPLSPTSPGSQSPHSPLWGSKAQEIEKHIDKLQAEHEQFTEEKETLEQLLDNGQPEMVNAAEFHAEEDRNGHVTNGGDVAGESATEEKLKMDLSPAVEDGATLQANSGGEGDVPEEGARSSTSSAVRSDEQADTKPEDRQDGPVLEDGPDPIPEAAAPEGEEAEGSLVIRAERVMVTDEGNNAPQDVGAQPGQQGAVQPDGAAVSIPAEGNGVAVVEEVSAGRATDVSAQGDDADVTEHTGEADLQDCAGPDPVPESTSPPDAAENAAVSSLPVYSESSVSAEVQLQASAAQEPLEGSEAPAEDHDPVATAGHFQDVPLAEPQQQQQQQQAGERELLLSPTSAPDICSEAETSGPEAQSSPRAGRGEDSQAPKHKTCQCCSVM